MRKIIAIFLVLIGFFNLLILEDGGVSPADRNFSVGVNFSSLSEPSIQSGHSNSPLRHQHSCADQDICGHQCHLGHCLFIIGETGHTFDIQATGHPYFSHLDSPGLYIYTFFKPPIT